MYSTNFTDAQWAKIKELIPGHKRKRKYDLRKIWEGLMYIVKTGCQWRMLPREFPDWQLVYYYYSKWKEDGVIEFVMDKLREQAREKIQKKDQPSIGIIDSQSVKTSSRGCIKGFDGNKKINGRKRHIVVDTNGWLLTVLVHAANLHDGAMAELVLRKLKENVHGVKMIFADGGYRGEIIERIKQSLGYILQVVLRKDSDKKFEVVPKRWIVERTFAWFEF